jgi:hypothetical protein
MCDQCKDKAKAWLKGTRNVSFWQKQLQRLIASQAFLQVVHTAHAELRVRERSISDSNILEVILHGDVIHVWNGEMLMFGYVKTAPKTYRPLHVVIRLDALSLIVITAYDPRTQAWKWSQDYRRKVCFKQKA